MGSLDLSLAPYSSEDLPGTNPQRSLISRPSQGTSDQSSDVTLPVSGPPQSHATDELPNNILKRGSILNLPQEIIDNVLQHFPVVKAAGHYDYVYPPGLHDLSSLSMTCKKLRSAVEPTLYHTVKELHSSHRRECDARNRRFLYMCHRNGNRTSSHKEEDCEPHYNRCVRFKNFQLLRTILERPELARFIKIIVLSPWLHLHPDAEYIQRRDFDFQRIEIPTLITHSGSISPAKARCELQNGNKSVEFVLLLALATNLTDLRISQVNPPFSYKMRDSDVQFVRLWNRWLQSVFSSVARTAIRNEAHPIGPFSQLKHLRICQRLLPDYTPSDSKLSIKLRELLEIASLPSLESLSCTVALNCEVNENNEWKDWDTTHKLPSCQELCEPSRDLRLSNITTLRLMACHFGPTAAPLSARRLFFTCLMRFFPALEVLQISELLSNGNEWAVIDDLPHQRKTLRRLGIFETWLDLDPSPFLPVLSNLSNFEALRHLYIDQRILIRHVNPSPNVTPHSGTRSKKHWSNRVPPSKRQLVRILPQMIEEILLINCDPYSLYGGLLVPLLDEVSPDGRLRNLKRLETSLPEHLRHCFMIPFAMDIQPGIDGPGKTDGWLDEMLSLSSPFHGVNHADFLALPTYEWSYGVFHPPERDEFMKKGKEIAHVFSRALPYQHDRLAKGFDLAGVKWRHDYQTWRERVEQESLQDIHGRRGV